MAARSGTSSVLYTTCLDEDDVGMNGVKMRMMLVLLTEISAM